MKQNVLKKACWVLFFIFSLFTSPLQAQHFEWAKGYASGQEGNIIKGSVTDSLGNLYILGQFRNTAAWDGGSHLLPMAPYGPYNDVNNVLIAKITPDGEMAWKKVIHCNNGANSGGYDIKKLGDTAFACLVHFSLPDDDRNYCYYLDTLLCTTNSSPVPHGNMTYNSCTALIVFDFEGHVLEQHFLTLTYLDNNGNDIMYPSANWFFNVAGLLNLSFDIDSDGNVYLCRIATDNAGPTYATWRGNVGGIKYWVDGRVVGQSEVRNSPMMWYPQLLKFSPHMDSLLGSRYLVQQCDTNIEYQTNNLYMKIDHEGNPYVVSTLSTSHVSNTITIDSVQNYSFSHSDVNYNIPYLLKLNSALQVLSVIHMEDSVIRPNLANSSTNFWDIDFDKDSNLLFLTACTGRGAFGDTSNFYSILKCQGIPLLNLKNDAFFLSFHIQSDTLVLYSCGRVPAIRESNLISSSRNNLVCKNNRIFAQPVYRGGVYLPHNTIQFSNWSDASLGIVIFDYQGTIIEGIHYAAISPNNEPGPISLQDSVLYLTNYLVSDATFGDIHVPAQGYNACVAKYVDTSFMTPYVYTGDTGNVRIVVSEAGTWVSYPNPFRQRVTIESDGQEVRTAWLTDLTGRREEVRLQAAGPGRYVLDLTGRPQATYLLTLVTADGQERTIRLLKQQDMFGE